MRFSIVFDNNGTILAAWPDDADRAGKPALGPGENGGYIDIPDDMSATDLYMKP